ncbi:MAG TPA: cytochrome c oxidase subunit 3 [Terriglobales bacterium]|nr:cytochrome c oxidase subunit 3 [Terriglobales bacterium]
MSTFSPTITEPKPRMGGGGGGPVSRFPGGGGGGGRGDDSPDFGETLRRYRLGLAVGLAAVLMLFVSFTSAYIVRQGLGTWDAQTQTYVNDWRPLSLPMGLLMMNTLFILAASFTIEMARRTAFQAAVMAPVVAIPGIAAEKRSPAPWLPLTLLLGFAFLIGQWMAWKELARRGFYLASNPSSSFFYVLTGMHGLHLIGGLIALLYAATIVAFRTRALERKRIIVDITAWYWHFMALLWLYIFALLKFEA